MEPFSAPTKRPRLTSSEPKLEDSIVSPEDIAKVVDKAVERYVTMTGPSVSRFFQPFYSKKLDCLTPLDRWVCSSVSNAISCKEANESNWIQAMTILDSSSSLGTYPPVKLMKKILIEGLLKQENSVICHRVTEYLHKLTFYYLPPISRQSCEIYLKFLSEVSYEDKDKTPFQGVINVISSFKSKQTEGKAAFLAFIRDVLVINFHEWYKEFINCTEDAPTFDPLIASIVCGNQEQNELSEESKTFTGLSLQIMFEMQEHWNEHVEILSDLIGSLAQYIALKEKLFCQNKLKEQLVSFIVQELRNCEIFLTLNNISKISLMQPDWLSLMIMLLLLNPPGVRTEKAMSLRMILKQASTMFRAPEKLSKIKPKKKNQYGETTLIVACRDKSDDEQKLKEILTEDPNININEKDFNDLNALHEASCHGMTKCVEVLLRFQPLPTSKYSVIDLLALGGKDCNGYRSSALQAAVENNHIGVVEKFIEIIPQRQDVFPNLSEVLCQSRDDGLTAMDIASSEEMRDLLKRGLSDKSVNQINEQVIPMIIDENTQFALADILQKFASEFCLSFVCETMKANRSDKTHMSVNGPHPVPINNCNRLSYFRSPECSAKDFRTFLSLADHIPSKNKDFDRIIKAMIM